MNARIDVERIRGLDVRAIVERDLGAPRHRTPKYAQYRCPFHEDKMPSLAVYANGWHCFGCGKAGGGIDWVMEYHQMAFKAACEWIDRAAVTLPPVNRSEPPRTTEAPDRLWQIKAKQVVAVAEANLWSPGGERALDYLEGRGIWAATAAEMRIGYIPGHWSAWKEMAGLKVPCGIVIPWVIENDLWQVKVRRSGGAIKYQQVAGGVGGGLYGIDRIGATVMIVEGEFDALIVRQTGLMAAVALGTASNTIRDCWIERLMFARRLYARLDRDKAGQEGLARLRAISQRIQPVQVPDGYKDVTEFAIGNRSEFERWLKELAGGFSA